METTAGYLNVYVPAKADLALEKGMPVGIISFRPSAGSTTGEIALIAPGYSRVPDSLSLRGQPQFARTVRVSLPPDHHLLPSEIVRVQLGGASERWAPTWARSSPCAR